MLWVWISNYIIIDSEEKRNKWAASVGGRIFKLKEILEYKLQKLKILKSMLE